MTVDSATNRISSSAGSVFSYDANGNMTSGPSVAGGQQLFWDYRNRLAYSGNDSQAMVYVYDTSNRRIWKGQAGLSATPPETYYLYGADGRLVASYGLSITSANGRQYSRSMCRSSTCISPGSTST